jgi:hypothetical protein
MNVITKKINPAAIIALNNFGKTVLKKGARFSSFKVVKTVGATKAD